MDRVTLTNTKLILNILVIKTVTNWHSDRPMEQNTKHKNKPTIYGNLMLREVSLQIDYPINGSGTIGSLYGKKI